MSQSPLTEEQIIANWQALIEEGQREEKRRALTSQDVGFARSQEAGHLLGQVPARPQTQSACPADSIPLTSMFASRMIRNV